MCLQAQPPPYQPLNLCRSTCNLEGAPTCTFNASSERPLIAPLKKLPRVLYIPRHTSNTSHLPLYDVSSRYESTVRDSIVGSSFYFLKLWLMDRPRGDGLDVPVSYLVNTNPDLDEKTTRIRVENRVLLRDDDTLVDISIPLPPGEECRISDSSGLDDKCSQTGYTTMTASYPLEPSKRGDYRIPHPYFSFRLKNTQDGTERPVQWQIHLGPNSLFRYVLVNLNTDPPDTVCQPSVSHEPLDARVIAIYQYIGLVVWLPVDYSEGLLMLFEKDQSEDPGHEAVVVASLLALLYQIRGVRRMQPQRVQTLTSSKKLFKRMLSKVKKPDMKPKSKGC